MKIAVIGAGSWGTALISVLSQNQKVSWWIRSNKNLEDIKKFKRNPSYLTNLTLNTNNISLFNNIDDILKCNDLIIVAIPSEFLSSIFFCKVFLNTEGLSFGSKKLLFSRAMRLFENINKNTRLIKRISISLR